MRTAPWSSVIHKRLAALSDMVGGYDFAKVIDAFWRGHEQDNETLNPMLFAGCGASTPQKLMPVMILTSERLSQTPRSTNES